MRGERILRIGERRSNERKEVKNEEKTRRDAGGCEEVQSKKK